MRRLLPALVLLLLAAPAASAQSVLPASVGNWNSTTVVTVPPDSLSRVAGPAADILAEYEAKTAEQRAYRGPGQKNATFVATVYSFEDGSKAYGAYSYLRTPDMAEAKFSEHSSVSASHALVLVGNMVLNLAGPNLGRDSEEVRALTAAVAAHALWGVYPLLPQRLPAEGLVPRTDRYILGPKALEHFLPIAEGDWVGFATGAEAELAQYRLRDRPTTLLLAEYPTPQLAAAQVEKLGQQFNLNHAQKKTPKTPVLYLHRDGSLIAMLAGAPSEAAARSLLNQVHENMIVTWNEPTFSLNEPSMPTMIVGTIMGTGLICAFTLLGGVLFTAARLLIKRVWPGKIFDRETDMEILQLGLSSKPIKAKDFY